MKTVARRIEATLDKVFAVLALAVLLLMPRSCAFGGFGFPSWSQGASEHAQAPSSAPNAAQATPSQATHQEHAALGATKTQSGFVPRTRDAPAVIMQRPEVIPGGTLRVPPAAEGWSSPIALPNVRLADGEGYTICRRGELGNDSYLVQYSRAASPADWHDYRPGATGEEERYQSIGAAQTLTYYFVPENSPC